MPSPIDRENCLPTNINMKPNIVLTSVQQAAADRLLESLDAGNVIVLKGGPGSGKTTILDTVQAARGGALLGARHRQACYSESGQKSSRGED